ncbi:MAG: Diphthamide biosynthesis protein 4 [Trichoglossum hirsutum]|nr:MAG: Diphthamide biosynthesis protein 4 [Trichoglossum hirsutum]
MAGRQPIKIPTYYEQLDLRSSESGSCFSLQDIRLAYRRALLLHHPDKSNASNHSQNLRKHKYTIDEITLAYRILSDPVTRAEYDRLLSPEPSTVFHPLAGFKGSEDNFRSGLETVDLDDLEFDEDHEVWYRSCRCGNERGFLVSENQLAEEANNGEIIMGCQGCSLWLRIQFEALEEGSGEPIDGRNA